MKNLIAISFLVLAVLTASAQDYIIKTDGQKIDCNITSIDSSHIHLEIDRGGNIIPTQVALEDVKDYSYNPVKTGLTPSQCEKTYGGVPTANKNMKWIDNLTPVEKYVGVIQVDPSINASQIIEAFMNTFQPLQDANIMTKQMRNNSTFGAVASSMNGDYDSMEDFTKAGDADSRRQYQGRTSWTVQFIDGVRLSRFYYNVSVQAKDGRYKLTVTPAGLSGYANDHIQTEWSQMFKNGKVKSMYSKYYEQMKIKLAYTIDQWTISVEEHLMEDGNDDW